MCSVLRRYIKPARAIIVYNILFSFHRIFQLYVVIFISLAFGMVCLFVLCAASMGAGSTNDRSKSVWMLFDGGMLSRLFSPFFFLFFLLHYTILYRSMHVCHKILEYFAATFRTKEPMCDIKKSI